MLKEQDAIHRQMLDVNADPACVGVITWMHTFSPAKMWINGLQALQKPMLHLHTQANVELPWAEIDMDFMNLNQAAHGDREFAHVLSRIGAPRKTVAGHVSDPAVAARIATWARAATGLAELRALKLARFGDNMRQVAVTEGDKVDAQLRFGVAVNTWGVNDLVDAVDAAPDAGVDALTAEYEDRYDVVPELRRGGERHESLRDGARIELGLRTFLDDGGFGAFTTNFEDLGGLRQLPGLAVQRLMADGYGFGAEGDWKTAVMLRAMKVVAEGLPGGTSFMEDYTYHLVPGHERVLGAHMLEVCPSIAASTPSLEIHPLSIGNRDDPVRLRFTAAPGDGVVVGLADMGDRFRLVANEIEVVEPDEPLPRLPVACAVWKPKPDLRTATESWLAAGAPHHTVLSTAIGVDALWDFAEMARTELVVIDADTTSAWLRQRAALEPGLPPPRQRSLIEPPDHHEEPCMSTFGPDPEHRFAFGLRTIATEPVEPWELVYRLGDIGAWGVGLPRRRPRADRRVAERAPRRRRPGRQGPRLDGDGRVDLVGEPVQPSGVRPRRVHVGRPRRPPVRDPEGDAGDRSGRRARRRAARAVGGGRAERVDRRQAAAGRPRPLPRGGRLPVRVRVRAGVPGAVRPAVRPPRRSGRLVAVDDRARAGVRRHARPSGDGRARPGDRPRRAPPPPGATAWPWRSTPASSSTSASTPSPPATTSTRRRSGPPASRDAFMLVKLLEESGYDGPLHFDVDPGCFDDAAEMWDFTAGCMRTYDALAAKARRFADDPEIRDALAACGAPELAEPSVGPFSAEAGRALSTERFDPAELLQRRYRDQRLDQLVIDLVLGLR